MEKFSLEKYETGEYDVITRNGRSVRIVCTDARCRGNYPIVGIINEGDYEQISTFSKDGIWYAASKDTGTNLFLVKKKWHPKEGEDFYCILSLFDVVCYTYRQKVELCEAFYKLGNCFRTKEEAEEMAEKFRELLKKQ